MFPSTDLIIVMVVILVGFASFGLGRLSVLDTQKIPVTITTNKTSQTASVRILKDNQQNIGGEIVASKNGKKYHFPWCSGAKRISKQNLITFGSIKEAQDAGYTPAGNCKGLK